MIMLFFPSHDRHITKPHSDDVVVVALSPDCRFVWQSPLLPFPLPPSKPTHHFFFAILALERYLATGCKDRHARVFPLDDDDGIRPVFVEPCERVYALDWSGDGCVPASTKK